MATKTLADVNVAGKTVLMRVDFNVPLKGGEITNDRRIVQALPSIRTVIENGGKLVLMSHLGRPSGEGFEADYSIAPAAKRLGELLGKPVAVGPQTVIGPKAVEQVAAMKPGDVLLLENVRFVAGETIADKAKKNPDKKLTEQQQKELDDFVAGLAELGDLYVNDAFGTCHRKHASMYGLPKAIVAKGGQAVAGFLVEKEIRYLHEAVSEPKRPFIAILGGAKVSDKIKLIAKLLDQVDGILIGGAMAYTLLKAQDVKIGNSLCEEDQVAEMKSLLVSGKIKLPVDHVVTDDFANGKPKVIEGIDIPDGFMGMDIGPATIKAYSDVIAKAGTVVWNGPMGVFEKPDYANGTKSVAQALADATAKGTVSVIGGGDSAAAVEQMGLDEAMTHISTGGGASLEYLEGKPMPPIEVLDKKG
ncbi:MAG: phosphoglycerate kinase [Myxococcota bacterium]|jgi:phosphoglycerate kinase|nr:phosphoglycerate kinase [Myxococcota bacterium]MBP8970263.1 phosphoglycerate kinase [Myxococcota bacterium]HHW96052.1 phosphoglycerate kinase [Oligoflexales bacterium]HQL56481.1 phosphoglycerate kinase [Myxococcota bacterium]